MNLSNVKSGCFREPQTRRAKVTCGCCSLEPLLFPEKVGFPASSEGCLFFSTGLMLRERWRCGHWTNFWNGKPILQGIFFYWARFIHVFSLSFYPVKNYFHFTDTNEYCQEINVTCFCLVLQTAHEKTPVPWWAWNRGWTLGIWRCVADKPCGSREC